MKRLNETFTAGGFLHQQVLRRGNLAIFRRSHGETEHFEVVKIQSHNGYKIAGNDIPASETYPNSNSWGTNGWTYPDEDSARRKFEALESELTQP